MKEKFNENLRKALESSQQAVIICKQAMVDANDESCRALYSAIKKDCEKHIEMLKGEIDLHIDQKKWEEE
ncbi:MAG: hypothetical protein ACQ9MH_09780 [Nitrospinales bacterium]|jgi:hypothetical protein